MRHFIIIGILILLILIKIIGLYQLLKDNFNATSTFFLPGPSVNAVTFNNLDRKKQKKIKILMCMAVFISSLLSLIIIFLLSKTSADILLLLALCIYLNDSIFAKLVKNSLK